MGRPKGALNKSTGVREHFVKAWEKQGGPAVAAKLLKAALERALGYQAVEKTYEYEPDLKDARKRVRVLVREKMWTESNTDLLRLCLPYFAQEMPRLSEFTGKDGAPLVPAAPTLPKIDMSSWTDKQVDAFIAATAAVHAAHTAPAPLLAPAPVAPDAPGTPPPAQP